MKKILIDTVQSEQTKEVIKTALIDMGMRKVYTGEVSNTILGTIEKIEKQGLKTALIDINSDISVIVNNDGSFELFYKNETVGFVLNIKPANRDVYHIIVKNENDFKICISGGEVQHDDYLSLSFNSFNDAKTIAINNGSLDDNKEYIINKQQSYINDTAEFIIYLVGIKTPKPTLKLKGDYPSINDFSIVDINKSDTRSLISTELQCFKIRRTFADALSIDVLKTLKANHANKNLNEISIDDRVSVIAYESGVSTVFVKPANKETSLKLKGDYPSVSVIKMSRVHYADDRGEIVKSAIYTINGYADGTIIEVENNSGLKVMKVIFEGSLKFVGTSENTSTQDRVNAYLKKDISFDQLLIESSIVADVTRRVKLVSGIINNPIVSYDDLIDGDVFRITLPASTKLYIQVLGEHIELKDDEVTERYIERYLSGLVNRLSVLNKCRFYPNAYKLLTTHLKHLNESDIDVGRIKEGDVYTIVKGISKRLYLFTKGIGQELLNTDRTRKFIKQYHRGEITGAKLVEQTSKLHNVDASPCAIQATQKTLNIMVGLPACGKSSFIKESLGNDTIIGFDKSLTDLYGSDGKTYDELQKIYVALSTDDKRKITAYTMDNFITALKNGENIAIDQTNLTNNDRLKWYVPAIAMGYTVNFIEFETDVSECMSRKREGKTINLNVYEYMNNRREKISKILMQYGTLLTIDRGEV